MGSRGSQTGSNLYSVRFEHFYKHSQYSNRRESFQCIVQTTSSFHNFYKLNKSGKWEFVCFSLSRSSTSLVFVALFRVNVASSWQIWKSKVVAVVRSSWQIWKSRIVAVVRSTSNKKRRPPFSWSGIDGLETVWKPSARKVETI